MKSFEDQFNIPGLNKLEVIDITPATPLDKIIDNINTNKKRTLPAVTDSDFWRGKTPIAVVGGGPSLSTQLDELRKFKYIMACGSVHDYLIKNDVTPTWCAVCDSDGKVMNTYLQHIRKEVHYLVASQCDPSTFEHFSRYKSVGIMLPENLKPPKVSIWHLMGDKFDNSIYGDGTTLIGGGCTIGTRAMVLAMGMGFFNLHLFGFDTCYSKDDKHHAYDFNLPELEESTVKDIYDIKFEQDGPTFKVAGYHLGQLFDIKGLMQQYASYMSITVHGESLLSYFVDLAKKRLELKKQFDLENSNGNRN